MMDKLAPMSEDEAIEMRSRAADAERILSEPLVKDTLRAIKDEIFAQWSACPARDDVGREWLWRHLKVAEKFEAILRGAITNREVVIKRERQSLVERALKIIKA